MTRILLGGRYQIIREIGRVGISKTYLAEDTLRRNSPRYAVKKITPNKSDLVHLQAARNIFEQESQVLYELGTHNQIPRLFVHLEQNGEFYLIQELIDGHSLKAVPLGSRVEEEKVIEFMRDILEVLAFVHEHNSVHGDLKPENIIRRQKDNKLVLVDFATVKTIRTPLGDTSGQLGGAFTTASYMSPEQIGGYAQMTSDVYALGVMSIQALTGLMPSQLPRNPKTQEFIWRDQAQISDQLAEILQKMVRNNSSQRYQSAMATQQALRGLISVSNPEQLAKVFVSSPKLEPIEPQFDYAGNFVNGLAAVAIANKYGYIDRRGKVVISPLFEFSWSTVLFSGALQFSEGLAKVEASNRYGYIDQNGKFVVNPQFDGAESFANGLGRVEIGYQYGYIDKLGKFAIEPQFSSAARSFREGLAWVEINGKYAYINQTGRVVIPPHFDSADDFTEGSARVVVDHRYGFIDKSGNFAIKPQFDVVHSFAEGLARVRIDDCYGYIDRFGQVVIKPQFDDNTDFSQGLAVVRMDNKYGYIDRQGKVVINLQFDEAYSFHENLAAVKIGKNWGYIDKSGLFIIGLRFEDAGNFSEGLAWVKVNQRYGFIPNPTL